MQELRRLLVLVLAGGVFPATAQVASAREDRPVAPKKLLIVARNSFHGALKPFVEHKKKLLPTEVVSLETALKSTKGADDAEKLKRYLYFRWTAGGLGYVLLVGDAEVIPVRYFAITDADDKKTGGTRFIPGDLYYSDLAKEDGSFDDWNASKEGINADYYGQMMGSDGKDPINFDQIDYHPDVALGRWPIHSIPQLGAAIAKTIRYEKLVLSDELPAIRRAAFVNGPDLEDRRQQMDDWGKKLENVTNWRPVRRYADYGDRGDKTPPANEEEVLKVLQDGVGMIFHFGHGAETCWDQCLDAKRYLSMEEVRLLPVMFSIGCETASWSPHAPDRAYVDLHGKRHQGSDHGENFNSPPPPPNNYQPRFLESGLGVEFLRSPRNGCAAYMGCCVGGQTLAWPMMQGFVEYIEAHNEPRLGDAWSAAVVKNYDVNGLATIKAHDWVQVATFSQAMKYQLFGDPSMRMPRKPNPAANLLVNGSFEDGPDFKANEWLEMEADSSAIKGWKVNNGLLTTGSLWQHAEGKQSLLLYSPDKRGGIEQTFPTRKGQHYRVSFSLSANPNNGRWPAELTTTGIKVSASGQTQQFSFDCAGKLPRDMGWVTKEWEFQATSDRSTLAFSTSETNGGFWHGPTLDNVRVVAVPPGSPR